MRNGRAWLVQGGQLRLSKGDSGDSLYYIILSLQPCYYALPEFEMIQQGEYLWSLDGSLGEDKKKLITEEKLYVVKSSD